MLPPRFCVLVFFTPYNTIPSLIISIHTLVFFRGVSSAAFNIIALVSRRPVLMLLLVHVWFLSFAFVCVILFFGCVWLPPCVLHTILSPFKPLHNIAFPHSVRSCEPALRAVEVAGGRPQGGRGLVLL